MSNKVLLFLYNKVNYYLLLYIIIALLLLYIFLVAYIKIKLRFWRTQPVFHIYNLSYWVKTPGIIEVGLPPTENNKYMNHLNIKTYKIVDSLILDQCCHFVKNYYAFHSSTQTLDVDYRPSKNNIVGHMEGANHASYISVYQTPEFLFQRGEMISSVECIKGVISARVLNVSIGRVKQSFPLYYVDNLCVHPDFRKSGIAPELIQTHYYNLRKNNSKIQTCLFKREGDMTAIVPLTTYETTIFNVAEFIFPADTTLHAAIKVIEIGVPQLTILIDFIKARQNEFDCVILPDITNVANMLKTENIIIYGLMTNGALLSIYVFRNIQLYYNGRRAVECIMALYSYTKELFITGFNIVMGKLKERLNMEIILMEDTAQAHGLIDNFKMLGIPVMFRSPTAFFLYNYACYSVKSRKFMILY
jgi:hypothetical protein